MRGSRGGVAVLAAAMLLVAGCGGDDDDGGGGLSRDELDKQSASICREGREQLVNLTEPDLSDPQQAAAWLTDVAAIFDETLRELRGLEPEEDLQADYDAYLAQVEANGEEVKDILAKAEAKDPSGQADLEAFLNDSERDRETEELARKAGLTGCAAS